MTAMTMESHALALAQQGWRVLPLRPASRIPKLDNWQNLATTDLDTVSKWWKSRPTANVGIATGYTFIVLDIDVKKGKHGLKSLSELRAAHKLPKTLTVKTPSGGLHLYYRHPKPRSSQVPLMGRSNGLGINAANALAAAHIKSAHQPIKNIVDWKLPIFTERSSGSGIDIRAEGGQVVAPGMEVSDFPGKPYTIVFDIPMAELPDSLIELLPYREKTDAHAQPELTPGHEVQSQEKPYLEATQHRSQTSSNVAGSEDPFGALPDHVRLGSSDALPGDTGAVSGTQNSPAQALVTSEVSEYSTIPDRIPAGGRDDTLWRFMCSWRERGYPLAHAEVLAERLHSVLDQPAGDVISLSDVITKLRRTYKTYQPSAIDEAAVQELTPDQPLGTLEELEGEIVLEFQPAIKSIVEALNRFVLCIEGNSVIDTTKHPAYANIKMEGFKSAYGNVGLKTSSRSNAKVKPLPKLWLEHTNRQTVDDYGYKPNGPKVYDHLGTRFYNKWAPSELYEELKSIPEGMERGADSPEPLKPFFDHLDFLFDEDEAEKRAFFRWLAYSVRYPERRVAHGVIIVSEPGVGKSWFYKLLQKLLGVYEVNTAGNNELNSDFNEWVFGCSMVVIHELKTGSKAHMMQQLLSLITEERLLINGKHKAARMRDIYANFLCFSNHANAAALAANDRRFLVYQSAANKAEPKYYRELFGWLETDGPLHLLQYMHAMDLSDFDPGEAPMNTITKQRMEYTNLSLVEQAIRDAVDDKAGPFVSDIVDAAVVEKYLEAMMDIDQRDRRRIRTVLANLCPPLKQDRYRFHGGTNQHRLRAVRDGKRWSKASVTDVLAEFKKALDVTNTPVAKLVG